jgi:hypothetical protein
MNFDCAIMLSLGSSPWLTMTFVETVMLALLADNYAADPARAPKWTRYAEALAQGTVQAGTAYYIVRMLEDVRLMVPPIQSSIASPGLSCFLTKPPPWELPCATAFLIGVFLGYVVPHWYRNRAASAVPEPSSRELPARLDPKPAGPGTT